MTKQEPHHNFARPAALHSTTDLQVATTELEFRNSQEAKSHFFALKYGLSQTYMSLWFLNVLHPHESMFYIFNLTGLDPTSVHLLYLGLC